MRQVDFTLQTILMSCCQDCCVNDNNVDTANILSFWMLTCSAAAPVHSLRLVATRHHQVTIKFEEYACGSFTFAPTAAPTDEPEVAPSSVTTPVLPLSLPPTTPSTTTTTTTTTPSPVDANANDATTADGSGEDADEDADGDEDGDGVEAVPAGDGSGASKVGRLGVALGVAVSAVAVAANVVMNKM